MHYSPFFTYIALNFPLVSLLFPLKYVGYPVLIRAAFALGGLGRCIICINVYI